jgi:hypothetical protein
MKTYMKTTLQKLVVELMDPKDAQMGDEEILSWINRMPAIRKKASEFMRMIIFSGVGGRMARRYLGQIRNEFTYLLNVLYQYPEFPERSSGLYQSVWNCLVATMDELLGRYKKYLDSSDMMPLYHYKMAALRIEENVGPMVSAMSTYHADKTLQSLLVGKMAALCAQHTDSWYRMDYLEKLQIRVLELCQGQPRNISDRLRALMLNLDFNTDGFIEYYKSKLERELAECYDPIDKYELLINCKCEMSLLCSKERTWKFDLLRPGISEVLGSYIDTQLAYLDARKVVDKPAVAVTSDEAWERLPVVMSVDVLAYFFKLLVKAGVIKEVKKSGLVAFISRSFRTPGIGTANLSVQSLESKYRQVTYSSAVTLKSILLKMLKQLNDEFGLE